MPPLLFDPWFLGTATIAVLLLGLSKGGLAGVGAIGTPLMALVVSPVEAAAIILPILIVQDLVGVWAFRQSWDRAIIGLMLPAATIGIALAYMFATVLPERGMALVLGAISILFAARSLWLARGGKIPLPAHPRPWFGFVMGLVAGVTSQIAHSGQPPFQMYVLPRRLPRDVMVGTTAIFFAAVNWIKVPAYLALGQFTPANLLTSLALMPIAIPATLAGVWVVRRFDTDRLYAVIYWLMLLIGVKLVYDGLV